MPKRIDSDVLALTNRMLRLAGTDHGETELDTDQVIQVLDVAPVIRRSLALPGWDGVIWCYLMNQHTDVETLDTSIDPYNVTTGAIAPYPVPVPPDLEFYILTAAVRRSAGAGVLTSGGLFLGPAATQQAWGLRDDGSALVSNNVACVARFTSIVDVGGRGCGATTDGDTEVAIGRRIPRGSDVRFTSTSASTADFQLIMMCALLPLGFGQDVWS